MNLFQDKPSKFKVTSCNLKAQLLIKKIQEKPIMVAIGHVGPPGEITSRIIETSIPKIREHADFIFLSDLALSPPPVSK